MYSLFLQLKVCTIEHQYKNFSLGHTNLQPSSSDLLLLFSTNLNYNVIKKFDPPACPK